MWTMCSAGIILVFWMQMGQSEKVCVSQDRNVQNKHCVVFNHLNPSEGVCEVTELSRAATIH